METENLVVGALLLFWGLIVFAVVVHIFILLSFGKVDNNNDEVPEYVVLWPKWLYQILGVVALIGGCFATIVFAVNIADWIVVARIGFVMAGTLLSILITGILYVVGLFLGAALAFCYIEVVNFFSKKDESEQVSC